MKIFLQICLGLFIFMIFNAVVGQAQGIRAVTRRTVMEPAPGISASAAQNTTTSNSSRNSMGTASAVASGGSIFTPAAMDSGQNISPQLAARKEEVARRVFEFHKRRASQGLAYAQYAMGLRYLSGDMVRQDRQIALIWLRSAAAKGYSRAVKKLEELQKSSSSDPVSSDTTPGAK